MYLSIFLAIYLTIYRSIDLSSISLYLFISLSPYLSIYLSIFLSFFLSFFLFFFLSFLLSFYLSTHPSIYLYLSIIVFRHLSRPPKSRPKPLCFNICKCASRHNSVPFFGIRTSKSGPNMVCFVPFDLKVGFAPQRRAIFHFSSGHMSPHPPL